MSAPSGEVFCPASRVICVGTGKARSEAAPFGYLPKNLPKTHKKDALKREYRYGR